MATQCWMCLPIFLQFLLVNNARNIFCLQSQNLAYLFIVYYYYYYHATFLGLPSTLVFIIVPTPIFAIEGLKNFVALLFG
jgi:polyferredoxin